MGEAIRVFLSKKYTYKEHTACDFTEIMDRSSFTNRISSWNEL
jgi:hypothetical protein